MTNRLRTLVTASVLSIGLLANAGAARAQDAQTCQPGLVAALTGPHLAQYTALLTVFAPALPQLFADFNAMTNQATYATLLTNAQATAASIATGRVVITLPDGTVVIDTSKANNTFANFQAKLINENHNSRLAILAAQEYPCGLGIESKLSSSTGQNEAYVAIRSGTHLNSTGTIRMSTQQ